MMNDRPNTACPPDGRYIEVLACNTGIADQNGNASVTLRNNSPYTVTGVTLALSGTDASKTGSMIPPVEAVSPPVPPDAEFRIAIRVPERWSSFRAEVSAFRSGDLVFTRARDAADSQAVRSISARIYNEHPVGQGRQGNCARPALAQGSRLADIGGRRARNAFDRLPLTRDRMPFGHAHCEKHHERISDNFGQTRPPSKDRSFDRSCKPFRLQHRSGRRACRAYGLS